jgi:K+-transporting ATPase ATPase C chain
MLRQLRPAIMSVLILAVLFGLLFPSVLTAIAQVVFPHQANGSLIESGGKVIGSELIGQSFAAPGYFHPRPSAAGGGYDAANSGATNLGPTSDKLIHGVHNKRTNGPDGPGSFDGVQDLAAAYRAENGRPPDAPVPADAVTRSASGLDPDISPANAYAQVARVAKARHMSEDRIRKLVEANVTGRQLGFLGEPRVNVLRLNRALDAAGANSP